MADHRQPVIARVNALDADGQQQRPLNASVLSFFSPFCRAVAFFCLLCLYGCDTTGDAADHKPDPAPEVKDEIPTIGSADLLDGFEGQDHTVWAFDAADDEGSARYVNESVTQGKSALKVTIKGKGKKGKLHLRRDVDLDLSQASALLIDIDSPAPKLSVALAFKTQPGDVYQESTPVLLKSGLNRNVRFPLDTKTWKNAKSNWQYSGPPVNLKSVSRIMLLLFTGDESDGSFVLDNLRVEGDAFAQAGSASKAYREWRPEILLTSPVPPALPLGKSMELKVVFRASYSDFFDPNDINCGLRIVTPSGRPIDARGFFGGLYFYPGHLSQPSSAAALTPLWGPFKDAKDSKDGKDDKDKGAADTGPASAGEDKETVPVWLIRFAPQETGRYTLQLYVRNSAGETRMREQSLVVASDAALPTGGLTGGNVRVSRRDPKQLELSDGSPFFIFGQNVCWTQDWTPYLKKIKAYGGNTLRVWFCGWGLNLERKGDPGSYDLKEARRLDDLLAAAEANGVRINLCLSSHGDLVDFWGDSPYNQANGGPCARPQDFFTDSKARAQFRRLLSYVAARWGSSPALLSWELMNEADLARYDSDEHVIAWHREMSAHLRTADIHNHLITTSLTRADFRPDLWRDPNIDFISVHVYGNDVSNVVYGILSPFNTIKKPVLLAEFGGGWRPQDDIPDKDGARLQAALWLTACSPCCGAALPWWWDTYIEARNLYPVFSAASRFIHNDDRRERFGEWVRKTYSEGIEVNGVMDNQGARLYVHRPGWTKAPETRGASLIEAALPLEVNGLTDGDYRVEFWDAREGAAFSSLDVAAKEGRLQLQLPVHKDEFGIKVDRKERAKPSLK
jgi:hypothetical protein